MAFSFAQLYNTIKRVFAILLVSRIMQMQFYDQHTF